MANLLRDTTVYLCGAIDHADDPRKWRKDITNKLLLPMGVKVYDPLVKPSWLPGHARQSPQHFNKSIVKALNNDDSLEDHKIFLEGIKTVRKIDLRLAHDCNFMICSLPKRFTAGTFEELAVASTAGKPILFHMPEGVVSTWIPAQVADTLQEYKESHFPNWDSLYQYLTALDAGELEVDKFKWIFLSYHNDSLVQEEYLHIGV